MRRREIEKTLVSWGKRHGLRVSDVYRDTLYYVDVVDDVGGKYEISICNDAESDFIKVRVWNHQKKSFGSRAMDLSDLEKVLEQAYSRIITWMKQSKGTRIFAP
jgi:hypothetical protein